MFWRGQSNWLLCKIFTLSVNQYFPVKKIILIFLQYWTNQKNIFHLDKEWTKSWYLLYLTLNYSNCYGSQHSAMLCWTGQQCLVKLANWWWFWHKIHLIQLTRTQPVHKSHWWQCLVYSGCSDNFFDAICWIIKCGVYNMEADLIGGQKRGHPMIQYLWSMRSSQEMLHAHFIFS